MTRQSRFSLALLGGAAVSCLAVAPSATLAATGARVLVQGFNPLAPDEANVVTLIDRPTLVSDSLSEIWEEEQPKICDQIRGELGVGGLAGGQTLYDITCLTGEPAPLDIQGAGQTLRGSYAVTGYIEATSTTPTAFGSYADPRFSVAFTAKLDLAIAVQPDPNQTLSVSSAVFTLNQATLDSQNVSADVIEFVVDDLIPFFGGKNFKSAAEKAVNAVSIETASRFNAALAPVNAQLKAPSEFVRVGVSANPAYISVAFGPRELTPPANGSMTGLLRWDGAQFSPRNGCQSFDIRATVQTGPTPLFTANAEAPRRQIGVFQASPAGPTACAFTLSGLANGWPNVLAARIVDGHGAGGGSLYRVSHSLAGDGWDGRNVVPQPVASERNYAVARSIDATASKVGDYASRKKVAERRVNPAINPADDYSVATDGSRKGDTVSLNPQPLPPGPDRQRSRDVVTTKGADAGIIIVSGKNADPLAKRLPGADRVFGAGVDPELVSRTGTRSAESGDGGALPAPPPAPSALPPPETGVKAQARVKLGGAPTPSGPKRSICEVAQMARARNSPAAPGLEAQCANQQAVLQAWHVDDLAAKGEGIAMLDPLAIELRQQQPDDSALRGFDIGMAVAVGDKADGPGKKGLHDALPPSEQSGYAAAVAFSVERNRNRDRAAIGAAIAAADPAVGVLRNAETDVFYRLGFDIATAIFGDPALGAEGNTATGPGSLGIRDTLSAAGQDGFNAAAAFHFGRNYAH